MKRANLERRLMELADDVRQFLDEQDPDDQHRIIADVVLVVGARSFGDDGTCAGTVYTFGNESSIPGYVARGLLAAAIDTVRDVDPLGG
ncbi:DUF7213 family protein [Mycobacteroides abscessus]|uniref:DUF7213 family protein n=1 Tax=Mycobacteroides abscessus TaxID=36809 RepID=UPI00104276D7|nr:hypothetical protein [Mycobacteroides abscessus]